MGIELFKQSLFIFLEHRQATKGIHENDHSNPVLSSTLDIGNVHFRYILTICSIWKSCKESWPVYERLKFCQFKTFLHGTAVAVCCKTSALCSKHVNNHEDEKDVLSWNIFIRTSSFLLDYSPELADYFNQPHTPHFLHVWKTTHCHSRKKQTGAIKENWHFVVVYSRVNSLKAN